MKTMIDPKVYILFQETTGPSGGGTQFLKTLKNLFIAYGVYSNDITEAQIILFNSHHCTNEAAKIKRRYPDKLFVHRIDGPMQLYNRMNDRRDNIVYIANKYMADATIFQSNWSQEKNHRLGLPNQNFETVVPNAPDPVIFNREEKREFSPTGKIRLVATSWSSNWKKGFETYQWLDNYLDFGRFEMVFIGNSPVGFKNIRYVPLLKRFELAREYKKSDIFIFASSKEACSNSLLEALHCGLPAVVADGSSNSELIGGGGEIFTYPEEIPALLEKIIRDYYEYQAAVCSPSIDEVGKRYYNFMKHLYCQFQPGGQKTKSFGRVDYIRLQILISGWRLSGPIDSVLGKYNRDEIMANRRS